MSKSQGYIKSLLCRLRQIREKAGLTESELEERLILGSGWVQRFETGETIPSIDMLLAFLYASNSNLKELVQGLPESENDGVERKIYAKQSGKNIIIYFIYSNHDAHYTLNNALISQFESVIKTLRDGLSRLSCSEKKQNEAIKTDAVVRCFLEAVRLWPHTNPSDLWWFLVYRAYCDPYNHPAQFARLDFTQSWKRTGGWALEEILVRHYGAFLKKKGINLFIADGPTKEQLIRPLPISDRIETDKIDVVLTGNTPSGPRFFGVVHVKASFAERRTDDVPLSNILTNAGFTSPLWTMDCKSTPSPKPMNRGELGDADGRRSAKRKDIEDEGFFTGCFSYNLNTQPSSKNRPSERCVHLCDFSNVDDAFSRFIVTRWQKFRSS